MRLVQNYRSRQAVLRLANTVRPQSAGLELALTAAREAGAAPVLVRCHDEATQAREVCARVLDAHESGTELHDQAGLVRARVDAAFGHAMLVRASDEVRRNVDVFHPQPAGLAALSERVRQSFDPKTILNRGRMMRGRAA